MFIYINSLKIIKTTMKIKTLIRISIICFLTLVTISAKAQYEPSILFYNDSNQLVYVSDEEGNHIPDFSYVGYKNGEEPLPNVEVVKEISPISGDNTAYIQAAIDEVEAFPLNEDGHRGALLLLPGEYPVSGQLIVNKSGVVIRGSGDGENPLVNTIIKGVGNIPDERILIRIGTNNKSGFGGQVTGTRQNIISPYLPAGSRTFEVADASVYNIGDNIIIKHPSTAEWLASVDYGGTASDAPWEPGEINLVFNRHITNIEGNKIQVATPIYDKLDRSLSQSYVYTYNGNSQLKECGIENLRIFIESSGVTGRDHVKTAINMIGVDNSWAKGVTILRVSDQGIKFDEATRCSVIDTKVLEMHGPISGGWRYNFEVTDFCNNILFENCTASDGRHTFVANGASDVNGIVFTNCSSTGDYTRSESHRRWGQGILWDNISWTDTNATGILGLHNRGSYGTGHGWTLTNGVAWNIDAPNNQIAIQKPPVGQNYAIGCNATVNNAGPFNHPAGHIEGTGENLLIQSLYTAQFQDRNTHGVLPDTPGKLFQNDYVYTDEEKYLELTWHDVSIEEDNYILERSSDNGINFETIATLPANTETYTDTELLQENYFYRLKATNSIGTSPASNTVQTNDYQSPTQIIYVSATGAGNMDGSSESNAFGNFGTAMANVNSEGDELIIIGTISLEGINLTSKSFAFTIEGLDASSTLEGNGGTGRLFTINGATSADVTFKNLTFLNNSTTLVGGGVFFNNNAGATATFENCTFTGNSVTNDAGGGAIYSSNGSLTITDCVFENNTSSDKGGAIVAGNSVNVNISGSLFNGNSATRGGAIAVTGNGVDFVLSTSTFVNNTVSSSGGGALYLAGTNANSSITNTTIFNNSVTFTSLNQSTGGGIRIEGARPFTITNSLIYGNFVSDGSETSPSDIGGPTAVELTLNNSITQKIEPVLVSVGDGGNDVFSTSITDANLSASNLAFNATSGYVEYNTVDEGTDSPIDFGSDGNDAGSWDSGFTLALDEILKSSVSIYMNNDSKTIEINHDLDENLSVKLFTILGSSVMEVKNVSKTATLNVNQLKTGVYILIGKSSGKYFSKKLLIN
jgi:predicted outer membrane repeat protein